MLNNSGESGHPCLAPDLRGKAFSFSPLRIMFAVGFSYMAFTMLRKVSSSQKEKHQYSILTHIYMEFRKMVTITLCTRQQKRH